MAAFDNTYSRFVAWTKIVLPLAALGLLSTLFLFARSVDPNGSLPFFEVDVEEIAREQRLTAPNFAGVTRDGASIEIAAKVARPDLDNPQRMTGQELSADIVLPNGETIHIEAPEGAIDADAGDAVITGGIRLETSTGYVVTTSGLTTSLEATSLSSHGRVDVDGPLGVMNAGQFDVTLEGDRYLLVFKNGVELVYEPPNRD